MTAALNSPKKKIGPVGHQDSVGVSAGSGFDSNLSKSRVDSPSSSKSTSGLDEEPPRTSKEFDGIEFDSNCRHYAWHGLFSGTLDF